MNPRTLQAHQLKSEGMTYQEVGERMRISRQRAQQLVRPPLNKLVELKQKNNFRCQQCGKKSKHLHGHHPSYKNDDVIMLCVSCHKKQHPLTQKSLSKRYLTRFINTTDDEQLRNKALELLKRYGVSH